MFKLKLHSLLFNDVLNQYVNMTAMINLWMQQFALIVSKTFVQPAFLIKSTKLHFMVALASL